MWASQIVLQCASDCYVDMMYIDILSFSGLWYRLDAHLLRSEVLLTLSSSVYKSVFNRTLCHCDEEKEVMIGFF